MSNQELITHISLIFETKRGGSLISSIILKALASDVETSDLFSQIARREGFGMTKNLWTNGSAMDFFDQSDYVFYIVLKDHVSDGLLLGGVFVHF